MKKKAFIIGMAVIVLGASITLLLTGAASAQQSRRGGDAEVRVTSLEKQDLERTVNTTGTVYSTNIVEVYSNMNYPVKTVGVQVGDKVSEGDILAELDMSALESDIAQRQASLASSQSSANQNLTAARSNLETSKRNLENGTDSNLVSARSSVVTSELDVHTSEIDVRNAEIDVQTARNSLSNARRDLREYRDREGYGNNNDDFYDDYDTELNRLRDNVRTQEANLDRAENNLERSKGNLEKAMANLDRANESYEVALIASNDNIVSLENSVRTAQSNTNFGDQQINIERMQIDLEKGEILAPVSGTVTEVRAVAGSSGSGLLFVIQDTDSLMVITNIKEFDIAHISIGDKVNIRADATGNEVFSGTLTRIAPTSTLTASGGTQNSTTAEFESEVTVSTGKSGLKIGMNTRLSIVTEQRENVYTVPFEAITAQGTVYAAILQDDGRYIVEEILVTTGMETDLRVQIIADNLTDGMLIIRNAEGIQAGMLVTPQL